MTFPTEAVDTYLRWRLPGWGPTRGVRKFDVGQSNPTYLVSTDQGQFVLRAKPQGSLLKSAHAIEREFRVLQALVGSGVPAPRPLHLCLDDSVIGSAFYVMEYVSGQVHVDPTLPGVAPTVRERIYDSACRLLVSLNGVDLVAVGLADFGKAEGYWVRQVRRWTEQYRASETEIRPDIERLIDGLPSLIPADANEASLVHGDFRLDNFVVDDRGEIHAVLDWELSTIGSPYADVAFQCAQWRLPAGPLRGLGGLDRHALGIPTEQDYVESYCRMRGLAGIAHWECYLAVSLFRLAAICQGIYRRGLDGNASSVQAVGFGEKTNVIAAHAVALLSGSSIA
jgi:aminoglycoside phosphotransferase (APT) family kinase protein